MKKILLFATAFVLWIMPAVIVLAKNTDNDIVFKEKDYTEFFKKEGNGDKNYLYTRTTQDAPPPGKCYVFTGASEKAIAVVCNVNEG